mmetsp:Transcript_24360/g.39037  ORF Transcript_24360/g.39037 Transcript_24360/m.39037 type:complete len:443 (-) Transcript_24360:24-1352(-)
MLPLGVQKQHLEVIGHVLCRDELTGDRTALHEPRRGPLLVTDVILPDLHLGILHWHWDLWLQVHRFLLWRHLLLLPLLQLPLLSGCLPVLLLLLLLLPCVTFLLLLLLPLLPLEVDVGLCPLVLLHAPGLLDPGLCKHGALCGGIERHWGPLQGARGSVDRDRQLDAIVFGSELDGLDHGKLVPINLTHLVLLFFMLLLFAYPLSLFLLIPREAGHSLVHDLLGRVHAPLELLHLFFVGHETLGISIHKGSEVAEERVCRLQEVELWVTALTLSKADEELLTISCHKLGSELDDVSVHGRNVGMVDEVLIWSRRFCSFFLLLSLGEHLELLLLFFLLILLGLLVDDRLRDLWLGLLHYACFELLHLVIIVRPVWIVRKQEGKLRMILLTQHTLLELRTTLGNELRSLVDDSANVRWGVDDPYTSVALFLRHFGSSKFYCRSI